MVDYLTAEKVWLWYLVPIDSKHSDFHKSHTFGENVTGF